MKVAQTPGDTANRMAAIQELGRSFGHRALGALDQLLADPNESIRENATKSVSRVRTDTAQALLERTATSDGSIAVRKAASAALASIQSAKP